MPTRARRSELINRVRNVIRREVEERRRLWYILLGAAFVSLGFTIASL